MNSIDLHDIQLIMAGGMFLLGIGTFLTGVLILVAGSWWRDLRTLTAQTSRIAQKGLAEEISGLVGNASALLNSINDLVHTTTGIGVFLTITGLILMSVTFWMVLSAG
jgi:hypothetical protein